MQEASTSSGQMERPLDARAAFERHRAPGSRSITKYENYFPIYDRHFGAMRERPIRFLEIGVQHGGSLQMWQSYFAPGSLIAGIDIYPACKAYEEEHVRVFIGDQSDVDFLRVVVEQAGPFDAILDDGSHIPWHQIASFRYLFEHGLKQGGVYLVEDCQTSYWPSYGGGLGRKSTFIEFAKSLVEQINYQHIIDKRWRKNFFAENLISIEFFSNVVAFRKEPTAPAELLVVGEVHSLDLDAPFSGGLLGRLILAAKRNKLVGSLVRRHPALWKLMKRFMR